VRVSHAPDARQILRKINSQGAETEKWQFRSTIATENV